MIINDLYKKILIDPILKGCNELFIVSGYSSATFMRHHLDEINQKYDSEIKINLLIGMKSIKDQPAFLGLITDYPNQTRNYFYDGKGEVHSKVYAWMKNGIPSVGFSGSANYSQNAFINNQKNQMTNDDPYKIRDYFIELLETSDAIENYESKDDNFEDIENTKDSLPPGGLEWIERNKIVRLSFLTKRTKKIAEKHSLNWGQRIVGGKPRRPNEAGLPINGDAQNDDFLPPIGTKFTLLTDDGVSMDCTRQQGKKGKLITTTYNNEEIGIYFRKRLNVPLGEFVKTEDLINYGRTDFVLKKLNEETFFLDFRKPD